MKNCPMKELCYERFSNRTCDNCVIDKTINKKDKEIARLTAEVAELRAGVAEKELEKHKRALRNAVWGLMTEGVYGFVAESEAEVEKEIQNELEQAEREIEEEKGE